MRKHGDFEHHRPTSREAATASVGATDRCRRFAAIAFGSDVDTPCLRMGLPAAVASRLTCAGILLRTMTRPSLTRRVTLDAAGVGRRVLNLKTLIWTVLC